ncbi:MAG: hypothetical protein ACOCS8_00295 [Desulfovermiculus sp.]
MTLWRGSGADRSSHFHGLFENTALALEYLQVGFENNDGYERITAQLAVEF